MFELMCAVAIGVVIGYLLKKENQPTIVDVLRKQVEHYEKEIEYYKDLCEWHVQEKERIKRENYINE
jgi:uncharacterized membrane protein YraQ (UPF0718 family)